MKRRLAAVAIGTMCLMMFLIMPPEKVNAATAADVPEGYIGIYTKEDLNNIRNQLDEKYILMNNIRFTEEDFSENGDYYNDGEGWIPIGLNGDSPFTGIFDGNGYHIEGIRITVKSDEAGQWGLFGCNKGTITRVGLIGQSIKTHIISNDVGVDTNYAGAIAGYNNGQITECYTQGEVESVIEAQYGGSYAGGIAGMNANIISDCYSLSSVRSTSMTNNHIYGGGICGQGSAERCYVTGNVIVSVSDSAYRNISIAAPGNNSSYCYGIEDVIRAEELQKEFIGKATVLTHEEMGCSENFKGFDFVEIWEMDETSEYPYPVLKNLPHQEKKENTDEFAGGNGTVHRPYLIQTSGQLRNVSKYSGVYYKLISDIKFEGTADEQQWEMIGKKRQDSFYGNFDGNGHVIDGLKIDVQTESCVNAGLFGYSEGTIRNLGVVNGEYCVTVKDHEVNRGKSDSYVGGIAGYNNGVIDQCYNTNTVKITDELNSGIYDISAGGISGYSKLVKNCYNTGYIMAGGRFPDAAGITANGKIAKSCYNVGFVQQIDDSTAEAGGISAGAQIKVTDSYSVPVSENHSYEEGTVFLDEEQMKTQESYQGFDFVNIWEMDSNYPYPQLRSVSHVFPPENTIDFAGGSGVRYQPYLIKTKAHLSNIRKYKDAYFQMENDIDFEGDGWKTIGSKETDAFCGNINGNGYSIRNLMYESLSDTEQYAGFIGYNHGVIRNISFENCSFVFNQSIKDKNYYGPVCGYNGIMSEILNCKMLNCVVIMNSEETKSYVGGIVGYNKGIIKDSCYSGEINTDLIKKAEVYTGGIAGYNGSNGRIDSCYVSAAMTGQHNLSESKYIYWGGIAASNDNKASVSNCFCSGNFRVTGSSESKANAYLGMILGFNSDKGIIENVYHCVEMSETYTKTGSIYASGYDREMKNAYYINTLQTDIEKGTALSAGELSDANNFTGFDFETIWMIDNSDDSDYRYPRLKAVPYTGVVTKYLLEECEISGIQSVIYTGMEIKPEPEVTYNGLKLRKGIDYILKYNDNIECGTAEIIVRGMGNYSGEIRKEFEILPYDISNCDVTLPETEYTYTGKACEPEADVKGLSKGKDYQVAYSDNTNAGTAKIFIIGKGNYTGIVQKEFKINTADIAEKNLKLSYTSCTYSGNKKKPSVKIGSLTLNEDFTVKYKNNEKVGKATVTVTGVGNYSGKITKTFKINPKPTEISSLKSVKRGFTVKWKKKTTQTTGYQIQYSTSSTFKNKKTVMISSNKTISKKITKLNAKKKYYVRIRTYKVVNDKKYFSKWSGTKKITTK